MATRWLDPQPVPIPASLDELGLHPLVARSLIRRGFADPQSMRAFLSPQASNPTPFPGIDKAAGLIQQALRREDPICVWGDFDVDGQTSTALLVQALRRLGARVRSYIPIRGLEGHGIHLDRLKSLLDEGAALLLTCDTGITAHEAVDHARSRGVTVVITDHHDPQQTLPAAAALVNPKLLPQGHPLADLAGVGVAYKLAEALFADAGLDPAELLDLVALGLVADVALLRGETRSLTQRGILKFRETSRIGLKAIADLAGTNLDTLTEETIGFTFAPRLNALGRLGDANPAVDLLLTGDPERARVLAAQVEGLNAQRRLLTSQVYEGALAQLSENRGLLAGSAIVLAHPHWPGGVVGIVASRLVDKYHKPALLFNESEDGILRGSARSVEGLHITQAIASQRELLLGFGGHPMAAGLSLRKSDLDRFRIGLNRAVEEQLGRLLPEEPTLRIDAWVGLGDIDASLAEAIESLSPFGAGNPPLILAVHDVRVKAVRPIGKTGEHLRATVEDGQGRTQTLLWWGGAGEPLPEPERRIDLAFTLREGSFRGARQLNLTFAEYREVEERAVEVRPMRIEIVDRRGSPGGFDELVAGTLTWAEGTDSAKGRSRFQLHPAEEFAIYTSPASPGDLKAALELVRPRRVHVFAVTPPEEKVEDFLTRLAGLCKYAIRQRGGRASMQELAAATAARESAVQLGLDWLAAGGHVQAIEDAQGFQLSAGGGVEPNPYLQRELFVALRGILQETAAFRQHFSRKDPLTL